MTEARHIQRTDPLRLGAWAVFVVCWWAGVGAGFAALANWVSGDRFEPPWLGAAWGAFIGLVMLAQRRGWTTPGRPDPRAERARARLQELAVERERILVEAKKNLKKQ